MVYIPAGNEALGGPYRRTPATGLFLNQFDGLAIAPAPQAEELLDELADDAPAVGLGELIGGDPRAMLARLRGEQPLPADDDPVETD